MLAKKYAFSFVEFCERMQITQSMSRTGNPYNNAIMERYFNTQKMNALSCMNFVQRKCSIKL